MSRPKAREPARAASALACAAHGQQLSAACKNLGCDRWSGASGHDGRTLGNEPWSMIDLGVEVESMLANLAAYSPSCTRAGCSEAVFKPSVVHRDAERSLPKRMWRTASSNDEAHNAAQKAPKRTRRQNAEPGHPRAQTHETHARRNAEPSAKC